MPGATLARKAIGSRRKPTDVVLLNGHIAKLPSKYLFLAIDLCCSQPSYCSALWVLQRCITA